MWGDTADAIGADVDFDEWVKNLEKTPDGKWKYQKPLDKSAESGIIEAGSDTVALENQRYGRNKDTLVNKTYISGGEYRRKFDNITDDPEVNKTLYDCAKKALAHRSGTLYEDMYWIDTDTGDVVASETAGNIEQRVKYSAATQKTVASYSSGRLATLHNHPASMPPSAGDFNSCYRNGYKIGVVSCHNGRVFAYTSNQEISEDLYNLYIGDYIDAGFDEFDAQIKALEEIKRNHDIDYWEVF